MDSSAPRCFVALLPDPSARAQLHALTQQLHRAHRGTRCVPSANLHLTLCFIGVLPRADAQSLATTLRHWPRTRIALRLDHTGAFEPARVLWAGDRGASANEPLQTLAGEVRRLLDAAHIEYDRKPFVPHVTLLRRLPRAPQAGVAAAIDPPIIWHSDEVLLMESRSTAAGPRYLPLDGS